MEIKYFFFSTREVWKAATDGPMDGFYVMIRHMGF